MNIIKNLLQENKKTWHKKLIYALCADRVNTKKSIWYFTFSTGVWNRCCFPFFLGNPVMKLLQEVDVEPNDLETRINHMIQLQQTREETQEIQDKIKKVFYWRKRAKDFEAGDLV